MLHEQDFESRCFLSVFDLLEPDPQNHTKMSRIPQPRSSRAMAKPAEKTAPKEVPSDEAMDKPSKLQKKVFHQSLAKSVKEPGQKIRTVGAAYTVVPQPSVMTRRGKEPVMQQMKMKKTVQRTPKGEYIGKSMIGIDVDPSGTARQLELTSQQIDPAHATESAGVNETVATTSTLSITSKGRKLKKDFKRQTVTANKLSSKANVNPHHVSRLVTEEADDVDNTLKLIPPDLNVATSVDKIPIKRKLEHLKLSAVPVGFLTQTMVQSAPTADEVEAEAPPEVIASVLEAVERGATPESAPNQVFNSLFPEVQEDRMGVSSVARGPLEDIVVPTNKSPRVTDEVLSEEMEDAIVTAVQNTQVLPTDDICSEKNIAPATSSTPKGSQKIPQLLEGELPPWEEATIEKVSAIVGGEPINLLEASDIFESDSPGDISQELSKGIDYFVDADVVPYETKIQIRGSKHPKWFPGYMSAFPHLPELVRMSKCPHEILQAAWKAVQPKAFPDDSLLIA